VCHGPACPAVLSEYGKPGFEENALTATSCSLRSARIAFGLTLSFFNISRTVLAAVHANLSKGYEALLRLCCMAEVCFFENGFHIPFSYLACVCFIKTDLQFPA